MFDLAAQKPEFRGPTSLAAGLALAYVHSQALPRDLKAPNPWCADRLSELLLVEALGPSYWRATAPRSARTCHAPRAVQPHGHIVFHLEGASVAPVLLNRQPGRDLPRQPDGLHRGGRRTRELHAARGQSALSSTADEYNASTTNHELGRKPLDRARGGHDRVAGARRARHDRRQVQPCVVRGAGGRGPQQSTVPGQQGLHGKIATAYFTVSQYSPPAAQAPGCEAADRGRGQRDYRQGQAQSSEDEKWKRAEYTKLAPWFFLVATTDWLAQ